MGRKKYAPRMYFIEEFPKYIVTENCEIFEFKKMRKIKPWQSGNGYMMLNLKNQKNESKNVYLHHIIAKTFLKNRWGKKYICHRDGNKENNLPGNLYFGTQRENMRDASNAKVLGKKVLNEFKVKIIKILISGKISTVKIAKSFGVTPSAIQKIKGGIRWKNI